MIYVFYDFETSSKELIGQILSYAFVVTDSSFEIVNHLEGLIKLNKTQCPDVDAILTNKLDVLSLQKFGDTEYSAANTIYNFLNKLIQDHETVTLVGFNSNQFDLSFLRTLLIKNGFNPYFKGKLHNKDILHWTQYLAFYNETEFPWIQQERNGTPYYSFKLEDLCEASNLLDGPQSHNALEDVLLTIKLVKYFESKFNDKLFEFKPFVIPNEIKIEPETILKQRLRHYPDQNTYLKKYIYSYFLPLSTSGKTQLYINLSKLKDTPLKDLNNEKKLNYIQYKNVNKHFFITEAPSQEETQEFSELISQCLDDSFFKSFINNTNYYFKLTKKNWDIEYQIHELGFTHIESLHNLINNFLKSENTYLSQLKTLTENRKTQKDNYLIQLFNRFYLNNHSNPELSLLKRYLSPKYITGTLYRNPEDISLFKDQFSYLKDKLETIDSDQDLEILLSLKKYYEEFEKLLTNATNA